MERIRYKQIAINPATSKATAPLKSSKSLIVDVLPLQNSSQNGSRTKMSVLLIGNRTTQTGSTYPVVYDGVTILARNQREAMRLFMRKRRIKKLRRMSRRQISSNKG